jgi:hypothetical protein
MRKSAVALAALALLSSGCFRTTVRSGAPPDKVAAGHDQRWHGGYLLGAVEASGPHDLSAACPEGWAQIELETRPLQTLATVLTLGIYAPQSETIVCRRAAETATELPGVDGP